jgi:flavin reductase
MSVSTSIDQQPRETADEARFKTLPSAKPGRSASQNSTVVDTPRRDFIEAHDFVEARDFVEAMAAAVTGVNIVTTDGPAGRFGLTVSAMCSVSAEPPIVLACIHRKSPVRSAILRNQAFCVNVLTTRQHRLANTFAGIEHTGNAYDFAAARWERGHTVAPRLLDAAANFDCLLENAHEVGSHTIFIGRVTAALRQTGKPLLYTDRHYGLPLTWD